MEQPCYKCGQAVEEGIPFCPHCLAPQIRVIVPEPVEVPAAFSEATVGSQGQVALTAAQATPVLALSTQWAHALKPCALAAMVASLLMVLGLHPFVAMFAVGFLAVLFFRLRTPGVAIKVVSAAALGAFGGLIWFVVSAVLETALVIFLHKGPELRAEMVAKIQQAASQTSDPQVLAMFDRFKSPEGLDTLIVVGSIFALVAAIVLAGIGGALGGAALGHRDKN